MEKLISFKLLQDENFSRQIAKHAFRAKDNWSRQDQMFTANELQCVAVVQINGCFHLWHSKSWCYHIKRRYFPATKRGGPTTLLVLSGLPGIGRFSSFSCFSSKLLATGSAGTS